MGDANHTDLPRPLPPCGWGFSLPRFFFVLTRTALEPEYRLTPERYHTTQLCWHRRFPGRGIVGHFVREILRPRLASWLDDNLPGLVERMVRTESDRSRALVTSYHCG